MPTLLRPIANLLPSINIKPDSPLKRPITPASLKPKKTTNSTPPYRSLKIHSKNGLKSSPLPNIPPLPAEWNSKNQFPFHSWQNHFKKMKNWTNPAPIPKPSHSAGSSTQTATSHLPSKKALNSNPSTLTSPKTFKKSNKKPSTCTKTKKKSWTNSWEKTQKQSPWLLSMKTESIPEPKACS
jgi:hypothetical protein